MSLCVYTLLHPSMNDKRQDGRQETEKSFHRLKGTFV